MNTIFRKSALSVAGLLTAGGVVAAPAVAAQAAGPGAADGGAREVAVQYEAQPNFYYCGPVATRIALTAQGHAPSQDEVAEKLGTTEAGTDSAEETTRVLNEVTGGDEYETVSIGAAAAKPEHVAKLKADVREAVDDDRAVVANIMGTASDVDGVAHSYEGGHYLTVTGYRDGGDTVKIADPYFEGQEYWMGLDVLADWTAKRGYSA
ncbi:C39 family peptidase [Solwaraspora sp. WMMA2080]|uniref:C39 family peptidase n=1 Tax=unclassified Solwaraspora TaxID=2627926 RepID=UPI00248B9CF1|nr:MULTISPECIES: C39 family peptidase [unclassified Solwaraspora]WBB95003.1 C39 family peptidase [Solwaraspora sp. WMMA2059]WBC21114.1 C39 family peptidase [Solwaraspora sp. WMMA2080]